MILTYVAGTDRTRTVQLSSLQITEALTSQPDTCGFILENVSPTVGEEVLIYDATSTTAAVSPGTSVAISVSTTYAEASKFRVGDVLWLGIGTASAERVIVSSLSSDTITVESVQNSHASGVYLGHKVFGGVILSVSRAGLSHNEGHIQYNVECGDYQSVLDRKLINNVYTDDAPHTIVADVIHTVNYGETLDAFEYASTATLRSEWSSTVGECGLPSRSTSDPAEGESYAQFPLTFSTTGSGQWRATSLPAVDVSGIVGTASGTPSTGQVQLWLKASTPADISSLYITVGSSTTDYVRVTVPAADITSSWKHIMIPLSGGTTGGTPDWTAVDTCLIEITASSSQTISVDSLRIVGDASYTLNNVNRSGDVQEHLAVSFQTARRTLETLAEQLGWQWWVDYERDIHFLPGSSSASAAPFSLTDSSLNHTEFNADPDISQLTNRVYVRGGKEKSAVQAEEQFGDGAKTTFFLRESPRSIGPYLYDVSVYVDTGGGYVAKTLGIANRDDAASFDFLLNTEEKYITNGSHAVLGSTHKLKAEYRYLKPILIVQNNTASQVAMKTLQTGTDGVYESVYIESSITSSAAARSFATAQLERYSNALVTISFNSEQDGLHAGQLLTVNKPSHGVNDTFLIQRVARKTVGVDAWVYTVTAASTLFGFTELLKLLLRDDYRSDGSETVSLLTTLSETITASDSLSTNRTSTKYRWAPASPTTENAKWDRFSWA